MFDYKNIENCSIVDDLFGGWPELHDAEIHHMSLFIRDWVPILTVEIILETGFISSGTTAPSQMASLTISFVGVEDLAMSEFGKQNVIMDFNVDYVNDDRADAPAKVKVEFQPSFGLYASFLCERIVALECKLI